jgi:hypothetical protein
VFYGADSRLANPPDPKINGCTPLGLLNCTNGDIEYVEPAEESIRSTSTLDV